ncbi:MAG: hypothetical protein J0I54_20715 [Bosea sp.]|uniref:hypothetical protein n=1 Tax=unclassified Bosea (in: a-proteobacteria) TaxID=2653178 RepID=UPI00095ABD43|nr:MULTISPECIES: hypothetical protein [unclassified Bosea (in: a-proteobacteria)]MBN9459063.1 hypothetical protein [Bosea sp. (in: a-proteobacteria)]OJV06198.1 MAG: hypothetical protein BGO20_08040 [Bosea sp. 67-29]
MLEVRENVSIMVGGEPWPDWESLTWTAAINEAARSLTLDVAPDNANLEKIHAYFSGRAPIVVRSSHVDGAEGDLVFTGKLDSKMPGMTSGRRSFRIAARGTGAALVDNAAVHSTGRFRSMTPKQIAEALDETNCRIVADTGAGIVIPRFQITPGETVFAALERMTRDRRLTLRGEADGAVAITKGATGRRHAGGLIEGRTLGDSSATHDFSKRHHKYIVRGQSPDGTGADSTEIEEQSEDDGVEGPRTRVLIADKDLQKSDAKEYAQHLRDRAAGNALKASLEQPGWRDEAGTLWTPGNLVWVESPWLDVRQDLLIERVSGTQTKSDGNGGGSKASLSLVDPRAYGGKKGKGNKSGSSWTMSEDE